MGGNICCDPSAKSNPRPGSASRDDRPFASAGHLTTDESAADTALPVSGGNQNQIINGQAKDGSSIAGGLSDVRQIAGKWCRQVDGLLMGNIVGDKVLWNPDYQHTPSRISIVTGKVGKPKAADIEMELGSEKHWARYEDGPPPQLVWSDGEVWVPSV